MKIPSLSSPLAAYGVYQKEQLNRIAFPLGGIGSGMICIEGAGSFSQVSLRHRPQIYREPILFSSLSVKGVAGQPNFARVLAGPVPGWKIMFPWDDLWCSSGDGGRGKVYGFPHFEEATFTARFPFAEVGLSDPAFPLRVGITAWNPFIPNDADGSSLPVAGVEYRVSNPSMEPVEAVFSFHAENFMSTGRPDGGDRVRRMEGGFVLEQTGCPEKPWDEGCFAAWIDDEAVKINPAWFRGGWFDPVTMVWKSVQNGACLDKSEAEGKPSQGGSLYLPIRLAPSEEKTIVLKWVWYVPVSDIRAEVKEDLYRPWYAKAFEDAENLVRHWREAYVALRAKTEAFTEAFYDSTLPPEVLDAVSANLTILKSPTVLRQEDGRLWAWEGCHDKEGSCYGSCTHVWNYAQALPHLFADLERGLRETEFFVSQNEQGHQNFRTSLPISPREDHSFHAAADGQLGGILKMYREWRISGDSEWLEKLWPKVKQSLNYCIETWDPEHCGTLAEPHHNTFDIEFWGEEGMCGSFYLGALAAAVAMGKAVGEPVPLYGELLASGQAYFAKALFNGEYFQQNIRWKGLRAPNPTEVHGINNDGYSAEARALLEAEGPKYQYGSGCLSDGVIGAWMGYVSGLAPFLDVGQVASHLDSVFRNNFKEDLSQHANPQRSTYALGHEAGLLVCTWPHGGRLSLPLPYSEEVWTGCEYQVASHLIASGRVEEGLRIVRAVRSRYDGRVRNPFDEFECGHWYARAMSSYALLQALSGARYDAVEKTLYLNPKIRGDFRSFLSTATGIGTVGVKDGQPFLEIKDGEIDVRRIAYGT